jgi:hypothetical protein
MSHAYFHRDGTLLVPDKTARSPWSRDNQSGLAIAGHLALALEAAPAAQPMRVARLSVDFLGAVLMKPTESRVRVLRDGKRMQIVEASLWVDGAMAATATALRLSHGEGPTAAAPPLPYPGPEDAPRKPVTPYFDAGHPLETRVIARATPEGAPGVFWSRFNTAFVAGEPTSPLIRTVMTADIATGVATNSATRGWRIPNADLSLYFAREPQGDWLLGIAQIDIADEGVAMTRSTLADETGVFGYARQTLVLSREKPSA